MSDLVSMCHKNPAIKKAMDTIYVWHDGQNRSDGTPYVNHPIQVASILCQHGIDNPEIIEVALYHDIVEDTQISMEFFGGIVSSRVLKLVLQLTNSDPNGRPFTWEEKTEMLRSKAATWDDEAKIVKIADRYHNLVDSIGVWNTGRSTKYAAQALIMFDAMGNIPKEIMVLHDKTVALCNVIIKAGINQASH